MAKKRKLTKERRDRFTDGPKEFDDFFGITPPRKTKRESALNPKTREPKVKTRR